MDDLFQALSRCIALHPDPRDEQEDEEQEWIYSEENAEQRLSDQGRETLSRLESLLDSHEASDEEVVNR